MDFTQRQKNRVVHAYRNAIMRVFRGIVTREMVDRDVMRSDEDAGEWAPDSLCIIKMERGIPSRETPSLTESWFKVDEAANAMLARHGMNTFCEPINSAVAAVYGV